MDWFGLLAESSASLARTPLCLPLFCFLSCHLWRLHCRQEAGVGVSGGVSPRIRVGVAGGMKVQIAHSLIYGEDHSCETCNSTTSFGPVSSVNIADILIWDGLVNQVSDSTITSASGVCAQIWVICILTDKLWNGG